MKKIKIFLLLGLAVLFLNACKTKDLTNSFDKSKYETDKEFIRSIGFGKSTDYNIAREIAKVNARADIANSIEITIKNISESYNSRTNTKDFSKFERLTTQISQQVLIDLNTIEILSEFNKRTNEYFIGVAMQINRNDILNSIQSGINDYDIEKSINKLEKKIND